MVDWTQAEIEATVSSYFAMLKQELTGDSFNKANENRKLLPKLNGRTRGAIEFKHQNISAVLLENGWIYISGYKPSSNYQRALRDEVERWLLSDSSIESGMASAVAREQQSVFEPPASLAQTTPPDFTVGQAEWLPRRIGLKRDYAYQEQHNRSLGIAGEMAVVAFERQRLVFEGKGDLATRVEHVSQTLGDGLGYDVLSFDASGRHRHIEVKTTLQSEKTPFFISSNEVAASSFFGETFSIYRLFNFSRRPRFYKLDGSVSLTCHLTPTNFAASPRRSDR